MNLILESTTSVPYFTDMGLTLGAAGVEVRDFDWYVSDVETNVNLPELASGNRWFTGTELSELLAMPDLQFEWAVFSAVPKGTRFQVDAEPFADGNRSYWSSESDLKSQLPGALFEVACWDSGATILVGLSKEMESAFLRAFPDARPLSEASSVNDA
jgi:hypothetical protein